MRLSVGTRAPEFEGMDMWGHAVDLRQFAGKPVLLSFLRNGACALCNVQVHKLIQHYDGWHQQGLEVVVVFESPRESLVEHVSPQAAPFAIIPDPDARLYDLYGVESSEEKIEQPITPKQQTLIAEAQAIGYTLQREAGSNFFRLPADFLIDTHQVIQYVLYSEAVGDHFSFAQIEEFLSQQTVQDHSRA